MFCVGISRGIVFLFNEVFAGEKFTPHVVFISFPDPSLPSDGSWARVGPLCTRVFVRLIRKPNGKEEVSIWYGCWFCRAHYCAFCRCIACCQRYALERPPGDLCHWLHHTCTQKTGGGPEVVCLECAGQTEDVHKGLNPYTEAAVKRQMERVRNIYGTLEKYTGMQVRVTLFIPFFTVFTPLIAAGGWSAVCCYCCCCCCCCCCCSASSPPFFISVLFMWWTRSRAGISSTSSYLLLLS